MAEEESDWFGWSLSLMIEDRDGDDPWPSNVERFRGPPASDSLGVVPTMCPEPNRVDRMPWDEFWPHFKAKLAEVIVDGSIPASDFSSFTDLIAYDAPPEMVDEELRCIWYDLWGLEPIPGAVADVPWFLPGYTLSGYMFHLASRTRRGLSLEPDQQVWLDERGLVWMDVPRELSPYRPRKALLDPSVLDEAMARVELGWLNVY